MQRASRAETFGVSGTNNRGVHRRSPREAKHSGESDPDGESGRDCESARDCDDTELFEQRRPFISQVIA